MTSTLAARQLVTSSSSSRPRPCGRLSPFAAAQGCAMHRDDAASAVSCSTMALSRRELLRATASLGNLLFLQRPASAEGAVPKAYEVTAQKLVDALREAISTDLSDAEEREVRRAAEPAKGLVREFLSRWKGNGLVEGEESYRQLSSAIEHLGQFYQQNGQRTRMSGEVGRAVLDTLDAAEAALPLQDDEPSLLPFF